MSFSDLVASDEALTIIATEVAHRALNEEFSPVTNSGLTPMQLMNRIQNSTIPQMATASDISNDLSRSLVEAVEELGL